MITVVQSTTHVSSLNPVSVIKPINKQNQFHFGFNFEQPIKIFPSTNSCFSSIQGGFKLRVWVSGGRWAYLGGGGGKKDWVLEKERKKRRMVLVRGFGFNGGGSGGRDNSNTARILGNLALAIGLTYLSVTGQLGWLLDAIVSIWLLGVLIPIVGVGAFLWWAGRDMVQSSCPNCGNAFQVFKSTLTDELQLCPFCSQPFSVVNDEFVRDPVKFSNQTTTFGQAFNEFIPHSKKGKESSATIVDVEAEVKDAD
ncbi:hypothetical protein RJ641_000235 [Dillenia turbinata]|uniref:Uncharacterized protein n=1 Tax=Dillenia turbinata TaxID=194707 RepID=A0AAN8WE94_9MAGN